MPNNKLSEHLKKETDPLKFERKTSNSSNQTEKFKQIDEQKYAKIKALNILTRRDYSKKELTEKLKKIVSEKVAISAVSKMENLSLINDEKYAKSLAKRLIITKKYGVRRALFEMKSKGINQETAINAIKDLEFDSEKIIKSIIEKKYIEKLKTSKKNVIAALLRRGFSYDDVKNAIDNLN